MTIIAALEGLVARALPSADVRGFTNSAAKPERIGSGGVVIGSPGDPGPPEFDLSPLAYTYNHHFPLEVAASPGSDDTALRAMLAAIGTAVLADRTLGGLVTWLDVTAPTITEEDTEGAPTLRVAAFDFVAEYTLSNPLA